MDTCLGELTLIGMLMGHFNDTIWSSPNRPARWWHQPLATSKLINPAMAMHPGALMPNWSTQKGRRAVFLSSKQYMHVHGRERWVLQHVDNGPYRTWYSLWQYLDEPGSTLCTCSWAPRT